MLLRMKNVLYYLNTNIMDLLALETKKFKFNKLHLFILVIFTCLVTYFMVLVNQTNNPMNIGNMLNNFDPSTVNSGMGGGGQNPIPGSEASVLGHNPDLGSNKGSQSNNEASQYPSSQGNKATEQYRIQDNMVAEQHTTQDNMVAEQHTTQDNMVAEQHMTQTQDIWKEHGEESWVQDLLSSVANARTPKKNKKVLGVVDTQIEKKWVINHIKSRYI